MPFSVRLLVVIFFLSCTQQKNDSIMVEKIPADLKNHKEEGAVTLDYVKGMKMNDFIEGTNISIVRIDNDKNHNYYDKGIDLITIVNPNIDTVKLKYLDTIRPKNYFRINSKIYTIENNYPTKLNLIDELPEHIDIPADNTFFTKMHNFSYLDFNKNRTKCDFGNHQYTYLYFWSPNCSPCLSLMDLYSSYLHEIEKKVQIIALARISKPKFMQKAVELIKKGNYNFKTGIAPDSILIHTGTPASSTGYLFDTTGKLIDTNIGINDLISL